jgi:hypothetical protein
MILAGLHLRDHPDSASSEVIVRFGAYGGVCGAESSQVDAITDHGDPPGRRSQGYQMSFS